MEAQSSGLAFGSYRLLRTLARGGMAEVMLAEERGLEGFRRRVVIKRVLPHLADDPEFVAMFLEEARLAALLTHPGIVHIYEFGCHEGSYFLAMEYVEGASLSQILRRLGDRRLPVEHAVKITASVCEALQYTHSLRDDQGKPLGLVHRDVSPQNVLVSVHGTVKLADFGIAKATERSSNTRSGTIKGKFPYMAPERLMGAATDARSDVFAVGVVLFEMLTGRKLYGGDEPGQIVTRILNEPVPRLSEHVPGCPAELDDILARVLAKRPEDRTPTAGQLQMELERATARAGLFSNAPTLAAYLAEMGVVAPNEMRLVDPTPPRQATTSTAPLPGGPGTPASDEAVSVEVRFSTTLTGIPLAEAGTGSSPPPSAVLSLSSAPPSPASLEAVTVTVRTPTSDVLALPSNRGRRSLWLIAACAVAVGGGIVLYQLRGNVPPSSEAAPSRSAERAPPELQTAVARSEAPRGEAPPDEAPPREAEPPAPAAPEPMAAAEPPPATARPARSPVEPPAEPDPSPEPAPATEPRRAATQEAATGLVSLDTTPWSRVYFRSRLLGETPLAEVRLPAGRQVLVCVDGQGERHPVAVVVVAGQVTRRRVQF